MVDGLMDGSVLERTVARAGRTGMVVGIVTANAALGTAIAMGKTQLVVLAAALPILAGVVLWVILSRAELLAYAALLFATIGADFNDRLSGTGGIAIYPTDLIVILAVTGYVVSRLASPGLRERLPRTIVLSWPLALFSVAVLIGVSRGHDRYGISYLSQPTRMVIYAGIATALVGVSVHTLYRAIVAIFYLEAIVEAPVALYHLASGTSQTSAVDLSTGGTRTLALSTAMYLAGALVLALLNLEFDSRRRRGLHLLVAGLATFGVVVALGRTTFGALALLLPLLFVGLRQMRTTAATWLPLAVPLIAALLTVAVLIRPSAGSTLSNRLTGQVSSDLSLVQREHKYNAALDGLHGQPILGLGFGRTVHFTSIDGSVQFFSGDPENSYVWTLAGGGYLALVALIVLILSFFADGVSRMRRTTGEARGLVVFSMSLAFIFFFNALTGPILSDPRYMLTIWIAMLLPTVATRSTAGTGATAGDDSGARGRGLTRLAPREGTQRPALL